MEIKVVSGGRKGPNDKTIHIGIGKEWEFFDCRDVLRLIEKWYDIEEGNYSQKIGKQGWKFPARAIRALGDLRVSESFKYKCSQCGHIGIHHEPADREERMSADEVIEKYIDKFIKKGDYPIVE